MCRLLGYLGPPRCLLDLVFTPPFSLERQAWAPRHQVHGCINADGWGAGWYDRTLHPEPARYRTATPIWADRRFREMAHLLRSGCMIAAVRDATPGAPVEETGNAPFMDGMHLFAHNGTIDGFMDGLGTELRRGLSSRRERSILGAADSEVVFAMVLDRLDRGDDLEGGLTAVIEELSARTAGRLNFLLSDGERLVSSRCGDTLFTLERPCDDGIERFVASEPFDDDGRWTEVPDGSIVTVTSDGIHTRECRDASLRPGAAAGGGTRGSAR